MKEKEIRPARTSKISAERAQKLIHSWVIDKEDGNEMEAMSRSTRSTSSCGSSETESESDSVSDMDLGREEVEDQSGAKSRDSASDSEAPTSFKPVCLDSRSRAKQNRTKGKGKGKTSQPVDVEWADVQEQSVKSKCNPIRFAPTQTGVLAALDQNSSPVDCFSAIADNEVKTTCINNYAEE
ncbi:hypothetical protein PoB_003843700 [Plakobranchus ocellatus]|uniref:Uncharacterized protein n=1 Tax=Plakobranchus ocellatus TaxID=259542 RepID=A0AAV4AXC8_9GAST|nr:hypothetical protein PoB_003843700 [Plakobranchus ocellatus]